MSIRDTSLKKFIYVVPGLPKRERVAEILQKIEQSCTLVQERIGLKTEILNVKLSFPIDLSLPRGVVHVAGINDGFGSMNPDTWLDPSPEALIRLSKFGSPRVSVVLKKNKLEFWCRVGVKNGVCDFYVELCKLAGVEITERIELLRWILEQLDIPVTFTFSSESGNADVVHNQGLMASLSCLEKEKSSVELKCGLSQELFSSVLKKLVAMVKGKIGSWGVGVTGDVPLSKLADEVNRVGFPSEKKISGRL